MMDLRQAIRQRHSVRRYLDRPIEEEKVNTLRELTETLNRQSGLHIQLVINESKAFASALARYGRFHGVNSYFALVGPKGNELEEACGYYGEQLVLAAQCLGLNTCWAALTFRKVPDAFVIGMKDNAIGGSAPDFVTFHADHPFMYVISESSTGAIFFIGRYTGD